MKLEIINHGVMYSDYYDANYHRSQVIDGVRMFPEQPTRGKTMTFRPYVLLMESDDWGPSHGVRFYKTGQDIYGDKELTRQGIRVLSARELTDEEFESYCMGRTTSAALAEKVTQ